MTDIGLNPAVSANWQQMRQLESQMEALLLDRRSDGGEDEGKGEKGTLSNSSIISISALRADFLNRYYPENIDSRSPGVLRDGNNTANSTTAQGHDARSSPEVHDLLHILSTNSYAIGARRKVSPNFNSQSLPFFLQEEHLLGIMFFGSSNATSRDKFFLESTEQTSATDRDPDDNFSREVLWRISKVL
jgi:hypothetical protein